MKLTNVKLVGEILERIELAQAHVRNIEEAAHFAATRGGGRTVEPGNLAEAIGRYELDQWRHLLMWGLTLGEAEKDRIKAAAYQRLIVGKAVQDYLTPDGVPPSSWLTADEEQFREMARKAFSPGGDNGRVA